MVDRRKFKGHSILKSGLQMVKMELDNFDTYIDEMESTLDGKKREVELSYESQLKEPQREDEMIYDFSDIFHRYNKLFPAYTYNSLLVSQFSLLESSLNLITDLYERFRFSKVRPNHLKGAEIEKYRLYFDVVTEITDEELKELWLKVIDIQKVRNCIVHRSCRILKEDKALENYIKKNMCFEYDEQYREFFVKDAKFLRDFNSLIRDLFTLIVEKLSSKKIIIKNIQMPYNYECWGQEKSENILKAVCHIIEDKKAFDNEKLAPEEFDTLLTSHLAAIARDGTHILSTFYASEWNSKDGDLVMEKKLKGLEEVIKIYEK